jgi:ADP-heptose:LPS heptosyltransferase
MAIGRFPILFITASRVGDAVLTSGLLHRLSQEIPHARFTVVASPLTAPLFRDIPSLDKLIPLEKEKGSLHWFKLWRMVRGRRWGVIVDMRGSALSRFLNARRRAVKKPLPPGLEPVHKVIEAARVLRVEDDPPAPYLFTSDETEAAAEAMLAGGEGPILAMAPAANWVGKTWPAERFAVVAAEMLGPGGPMANGRLLLLGGPSDRFAAEAVRRVIPRARLIDTVGRVDLLTAYALLKRARLFIGNDSGLMHLAAAAGAPTLGLFGPSDERLYAPWGPRARALRGPREFEAFKKIDPDLNQVVCHMFDLPTPWVTAAARKLFDETAEPVEIEAIDAEATEVVLLEGPVEPVEPEAVEVVEVEVEVELDAVEDPSPTSASA